MWPTPSCWPRPAWAAASPWPHRTATPRILRLSKPPRKSARPPERSLKSLRTACTCRKPSCFHCWAAASARFQGPQGAIMREKVVLAYSGGLDTSIIIPWLKENYNCEVIAMIADVGQGDDIDAVVEKAHKTGAAKVVVEDLRAEFLNDYVFPALRAGAVYEHKYLLGTSLARPVIAKHQVEIALRENATALAHGCTGKGNDQVRFEHAFQALAPDLKVIAPWREWTLKSREDCLDYAEQRGITVEASRAKIHSRDRNLWHISHEGGELEDPANAPFDST